MLYISFFPFPSDESLLEEDSIDSSSLRTEFANCAHLDDPSDVASFVGGNNRYSLGHNQARVSSKFLPSNQRYHNHLFHFVISDR